MFEFRYLYNSYNNGKIPMSVRQAARLLNCDKDTAANVLKELEEKGWIAQTVKGSFSQKTNKTASEWRITNQPVGMGVDTPETKEYMRWKPEEKQNTVPLIRTKCPTTRDHKKNNGATKSDRTSRNGPNSTDHNLLELFNLVPINRTHIYLPL